MYINMYFIWRANFQNSSIIVFVIFCLLHHTEQYYSTYIISI